MSEGAHPALAGGPGPLPRVFSKGRPGGCRRWF